MIIRKSSYRITEKGKTRILRKKPVLGRGGGLPIYKADEAVKGKDGVALCVSMTVDQLLETDAMARKLRMNRSHMIREALKLYVQHIERKLQNDIEPGKVATPSHIHHD